MFNLPPVHRFHDAHMHGVIVAPDSMTATLQEYSPLGDDPGEFKVSYVGSPGDIQKLVNFFGLTQHHKGDVEEGTPFVYSDDNGSYVTVDKVEKASDVLGTIRIVAESSGQQLPPWLS